MKGLVAAGELAVIYGPPKSGKTFLAMDLALSVAAGVPWFGRRVRAGLVIYIASEMGIRAMRRVRAWTDTRLGDATELRVRFVCVPCVVNLLNSFEVDRLIVTIESLLPVFGRPSMVVIDTLARSMVGGDENSAQDMGRAVSVGDQLRDIFGAATVVVHHSGKTTASGARGSSALLGAADTMLRVDADDSGLRVAEVEWCRDGEAGSRLGFKLKPIELGVDSDGDVVSTCVVEALETPPAAAKAQRVPKGGETALRALREAVEAHGERLPATSAIPPGVKAVSVNTWRERFYYYTPPDVDAGSTAESTARAMDARRKRFGRILDALQGSGLIGVAGGYAWPY